MGSCSPCSGETSAGWASRHPSLPPSVPAVGAGMGEHPRSCPKLDGTVGHWEGLYAAPTQVFALCLSFPAGKHASPPAPRGCAGFGTIANLHIIILGAESSITQSQDC